MPTEHGAVHLESDSRRSGILSRQSNQAAGRYSRPTATSPGVRAAPPLEALSGDEYAVHCGRGAAVAGEVRFKIQVARFKGHGKP
jgi:hypothetical protein